MKISEILGKPVISIYDANLQGYVKGILVDKQISKIIWIEIFDDDTQEEKLVSAKSIYSLSNDAIMLKNGNKIYFENTITDKGINPIGIQVFSTLGEKMDKIVDIEFEINMDIYNIVLSNNDILNKDRVIRIGKNILIYAIDPKIKISYFKPKTKIKINKIDNYKVEILQDKDNKKADT